MPGTTHQRDGVERRARALADPLGHLVGEQTGHAQSDHTSCSTAPCTRFAGSRQTRGYDEPQLGVVGGAGERGHHRVEQGRGRLRYRLEDLPVECPEALRNALQTRSTAKLPNVHDA
jgi:hypothetical protein